MVLVPSGGADGGVQLPVLELTLCVVVSVEADGTDAEKGWTVVVG